MCRILLAMMRKPLRETELRSLASVELCAPARAQIVETGSKASVSKELFASGFLLDWLTGANLTREEAAVVEPEMM